jgi:outer membrane protein assembly factor BamB
MRWTFQTGDEVNSSPIICGDKVVFGSDDGWLYVVGLADGRQLWSYPIGQPISGSPAFGEGVLVIGADDGWVYAFGAE